MVKDLNDPTNVDTIPAMLTEGEYVVNKEATAMYGPLIEKMNQAGLQQRHVENQQVVSLNTGGGVGSFIKEKEGYRDKAYQDSAGIWTIGYGRTTNPDGSAIKPGQTTSKEQEEAWLGQRLDQERSAVKQYGEEHGYQWSPSQIDALASFRYNGGQGMLDQLTAGGKRSNEEITAKIPEYNKTTIDGQKVPLKGLTNRRLEEQAMFAGTQQQPEVQAGPLSRPTQTTQQTAQPAQAPEVSPSEGFRGMPMDFAGMALRTTLGQRQPIMHQGGGRQYTTASADPLINKDNLVRTFNNGGATWWNPLSWFDQDEAKKQQFGNALKNRPGFRNLDPFAGTIVDEVPAQPTLGTRPFSETPYAPIVDGAVNQLNNLSVPVYNADGTPPQVDMVPPPGSDEDLLQNSSDAQENTAIGSNWAGYADYSPEDFVKEAERGNEIIPTAEDIAYSTLQNPNATPEEIAEAQATVSNVSSFTQPVVQDTAGQLGIPTDAEGKPLFGEEAKEMIKRTANSINNSSPHEVEELKTNVSKVIEAKGEQPPANTDFVAVEQAGNRAPPQEVEKSKGLLASVFGDLFNKKELARAALLMAGGMATGMSAGQALGFAGQNYLGRIDAMASNKAQTKKELLKGGKYTPESVQAFSESGDASLLMPSTTDSPMTETGQIKDFYSPTGKVTGRKVKVGDNEIWVDKNNKPINPHTFNEDPANVRGTPEYRTRIKQSSTAVKDSLDELKNTFGARGEDRDGKTQYATDILPSVQAGKIAEWAAKNGVAVEEVSGLVESAYHDAINNKRQDGARVRDLVPYLNQLVIRQSVGASADVFRLNAGEEGPPQYIDTEKMTILNSNAARLLKSRGFDGGSQDLANQFYTAAISDWTKLGPDAQKEYERKANKGENGFFHYVSSRMDKYLLQ